MKNKLKASIIIPTYNREELLSYTLTSLENQSLSKNEFEVIVSDDGSIDNTKDIVLSYQNNLNLQYVYQEDLGYRPASARNLGISVAKGDICLFIDSGLLLDECCLQMHLSFHQQFKFASAAIGYIYGFEETKPTQMTIKRHLEEEGYKVGHISTEPQGVLLNADFVFPFGYKSTVRLPLERWGNFIQKCIKGIQDSRQPDILITGIQGGLLPRGTQFLNTDTTHCLSSLNYLLAVKPNGLICTIGPNDDPALIKETVGVAKTYVTCDPLFYALTPVYREFRQNQSGGVVIYNRKISPSEMHEKAKYFEHELGKPVIDISDAANARFIITTIQTKFS